jgi:hypothetical protein
MNVSFFDNGTGVRFQSDSWDDGKAGSGPEVQYYGWIKSFGEDKSSMFGFLDRLKALSLTAKNALEVATIEPFDEKDVTVANNNAFLSFVGNALEIDGGVVRFGLPLRGVESELILDFGGSEHGMRLGELYKIELKIGERKAEKPAKAKRKPLSE